MIILTILNEFWTIYLSQIIILKKVDAYDNNANKSRDLNAKDFILLLKWNNIPCAPANKVNIIEFDLLHSNLAPKPVTNDTFTTSSANSETVNKMI